MSPRWRAGDREAAVEVTREADGRFRVRVDGAEWIVSAEALGDGTLMLRGVDGEQVVVVTPHGGRRYVRAAGHDWVLERQEGTPRRGTGGGEHGLTSPMPGLVVKLHVKVGDRVAKAAPLVTIEAMKMEHVLRAPHTGTVAAVSCAQGEMVEAGVALVEIAEG